MINFFLQAEDGIRDRIVTGVQTCALPISFTNGYFKATEFTDVSTSRHGRTFTINIKYRFGQMQRERDRNRPGRKEDGGGNMDMGF